MTLFIEGFVVTRREVTSLSGWDARRYALCQQSLSELVAVISLVTKQSSGTFRQCRINQFGPDMVAHLAFGQAQDDRSPQTIHYRVQL